jgi:uncharacterized Rossmann fold enzyme
MNFETFEPIYEAILEDFGFDRRADERSRDVAAARATPFPISRFDGWVDATVAIVGAAPCLTAELDRVRSADIVVAASTAVDVLSANDIAVGESTDVLDGADRCRLCRYHRVVAVEAGEPLADRKYVVAVCVCDHREASVRPCSRRLGILVQVGDHTVDGDVVR